MPHAANWLHLVWAVKERRPLLTDAIRPAVFAHMRANAQAKGLLLDHLNGWRDHVHVLLKLPPDTPLAKAVQLLKGESSHWLNAEKLTPEPFAWQTEYWAASVSPGHLAAVRTYIRGQEEHHRATSFEEEIARLLHRWQLIGG